MRPSTLAEAVERICAGEPQDTVLAEFVDTFLLAPDVTARCATIADGPRRSGDEKLDALIGAVGEYLAKHYRLPAVPSWVSAPWRRLDKPWFTTSSQSPGMKEYLSFSSPSEFRSRNIFTEARPLRRARSHLPFADRNASATLSK
jgi:hypothetical protein